MHREASSSSLPTKRAITNQIGPLECETEKQKVRPITVALHQMDMRDETKGFRKRSVWRVRLTIQLFAFYAVAWVTSLLTEVISL